MTVIVESPDQARVERIGDSQPFEPGADRCEKFGRLGIETVAEQRRFGDDFAIARVFRVENSKRIPCEPRKAFLGQLVPSGFQVIDQHTPIGFPAVGIAESVQLERRPCGNAELLQNGRAERDDLDIADRFRDAKQLHPDLMELAQPSLLRPLVAEHRASIEVFERHVLGKTARNYGARHPRGSFRAKRHLGAAPISEGVHFLRDDVRRVAERALEDLRKLEDRRCHLVVAVTAGDRPRGIRDAAEGACPIGQEVVRAANRLQLGHFDRRRLGPDGARPGRALSGRIHCLRCHPQCPTLLNGRVIAQMGDRQKRGAHWGANPVNDRRDRAICRDRDRCRG